MPLYEGCTFPAGLSHRVKEHLKTEGEVVRIIDPSKPNIDLSGWNRNLIPGVTLWDHQYEAGLALLTQPRGSIKVATSGGKSLLAYAIARYLYDLYGWMALVMTPKRGLVRQTARMFCKFAGDDVSIGMLGDGVKIIGDITVATPQTTSQYKGDYRAGGFVSGNKKIARLLERVKVLICDECHKVSGNEYHDIAMACPNAVVRIAMSGTPMTYKELKDLRMIGATGPVVFETGANELIDAGLSAKPKIAIVMSDDASGPSLRPKTKYRFNPRSRRMVKFKYFPKYQDVISRQTKKLIRKGAYRLSVVENERHNLTVIECVEWMVKHGRQTLLVCRMKDHFRTLKQMLEDRGLMYSAVWGASSTAQRDYAKRLLAKRRINVLLASDVYTEGEDVPCIEAIVLAEGVKTNTSAVQRIGRGMRLEKGGVNDVWVVDVIPTTAPVMIEHGLSRCLFYEGEGYETRLVENWPTTPDDLANYDDLLPFLKWDETVAA